MTDEITTCACGCGQAVRPGKTWRLGHNGRANRRPGPRRQLETGVCPHCGMTAPIRKGGGFGRHWSSGKKYRTRCPQGEMSATPVPTGRRMKVTIDVVIPADMNEREYRQEAAALLRRHAADAFLVSLHVEEGAEL